MIVKMKKPPTFKAVYWNNNEQEVADFLSKGIFETCGCTHYVTPEHDEVGLSYLRIDFFDGNDTEVKWFPDTVLVVWVDNGEGFDFDAVARVYSREEFQSKFEVLE